MKKGTLIKCILLIAAMGLTSCGKTSSSGSSITTVNPTLIAIENYVTVSDSDSTSSIKIQLLNLHSDLDSIYSGIDMELNLGTVIGNHTDLDANQGGDITLHKTNSSGTVSYSYFTSGGNTLQDVKENYWSYNSNNKLVWRGVFEGPTGVLVVVVDGVYSSGDGSDPYDYMSGSIWYMPWQVVADTGINSNKCYVKNGRLDCKNPAAPPTRCWDVSLGPYDCRFTVSANSQNVTATGNQYMTQDYTKVATFINLSKESTFKESY